MSEDNLSRQADEIEALSSIYGDDWCVDNAAQRLYHMRVSGGDSHSPLNITLQVTLPAEYPSSAPPQYQLKSSVFSADSRRLLANELEEIYCENIGECILFLWVERIREFIGQRGTHCEEPPVESVTSEDLENSSEEEEDFDADEMAAKYASEQQEPQEKKEGLTLPEIHHGELVKDRKSVFQAHLAEVHHEGQVKMVVEELKKNKKIFEATHNIQAYRISEKRNGRTVYYRGSVDDGETHAGNRMLHLLELSDACDVLVVVTRWYGGVHLGPDRFKHINRCTQEILQQHGYIPEKDPKTKKKGKGKKAAK